MTQPVEIQGGGNQRGQHIFGQGGDDATLGCAIGGRPFAKNPEFLTEILMEAVAEDENLSSSNQAHLC